MSEVPVSLSQGSEQPEAASEPMLKTRRKSKLFRRAAAGIIGLFLAITPQACVSEGKIVSSKTTAISSSASLENKKSSSENDVQFPEFESINQHQRAIVLLAKERGTKPNLSTEQEREIFKKVANFYKEQSYGKMDLQFNIVDWHDFPGSMEPPAPKDESRALELTSLFNSELESLNSKGGLPEGLSLAGYQTRIYVMDQGQRSTIQGWGQHATLYNRVWINQGQYSGREEGVAHEFGHALGLGHVLSLGHREPDNFTNNIDISSGAGGNTVMGSGYEDGFSGPQRLQLEWIDRSQVITLTQSADVELTSIDNPTGDKLLRIPKRDTGEYYYVDYKTYPNFDPTLRFYIWDEKSTDLKEIGAPTNQGTYTSDGGQFYDKINGIGIKQVSHSSHGVGLSVTFGNPAK